MHAYIPPAYIPVTYMYTQNTHSYSHMHTATLSMYAYIH